MCSQNSAMATRVNVIFVNLLVSYFIPLEFLLDYTQTQSDHWFIPSLTVMVVHVLYQEIFKVILKDRFFRFFISPFLGRGRESKKKKVTLTQTIFNMIYPWVYILKCVP